MPMRTCNNPRCNKGTDGKRKQFNARQADINRGWGKYCDKSCKAQHQESQTGQYAAHQRNVAQGNYGGGHEVEDPSDDAYWLGKD